MHIFCCFCSIRLIVWGIVCGNCLFLVLQCFILVSLSCIKPKFWLRVVNSQVSWFSNCHKNLKTFSFCTLSQQTCSKNQHLKSPARICRFPFTRILMWTYSLMMNPGFFCACEQSTMLNVLFIKVQTHLSCRYIACMAAQPIKDFITAAHMCYGLFGLVNLQFSKSVLEYFSISNRYHVL